MHSSDKISRAHIFHLYGSFYNIIPIHRLVHLPQAVTATSWTGPGSTVTRRTRTRPATSPSRVTTPCPPSPRVLCRAVGGPGPEAPADIGGQTGGTRRRGPGRETGRTPSPTRPGRMRGETDADRHRGKAQRDRRRPRNMASRTSDRRGRHTHSGPRGSRSSGITNESLTEACAECCWESALSSWFWEFLE